jgi:hypothetical protein
MSETLTLAGLRDDMNRLGMLWREPDPVPARLFVSHHLPDGQRIRYRGWKRFRAWYEASCRRMGAETPWEHLPTHEEPAAFAMRGVGIFVGPRTYAGMRAALERAEEVSR